MKPTTEAIRMAPSWKLVITTAVTLVLISLSGCVSMSGATIEDTGGRFSFSRAEVLEEVPSDGSYYHYYLPGDDVHAFVVAQSAATEDQALYQVFIKAGLDADRFGASGSNSMGDWKLQLFLHDETGEEVAVASQYRGDTIYAVIVTTENEQINPGSPPPAIMGIVGSMRFTEAAGEIFVPADFGELESFVQKTSERSGGSISIAVLRDGEVIYTFAAGERTRGVPTDVGVAYNWGSITKLVTATAFMQQVELGLVDIDAAVSRYIPEFELGNEITLRNLLTHSSGLPDFDVNHLIGFNGVAVPDLETVLAEYVTRATEFQFEPGSKSQYNNWNFLILGVIVERITDTPLTQYAREHIFDPISMNETAHLYHDLSITDANPIINADSKSAFVYYMESHGVDATKLILDEDDDFLYLEHIDIVPAWGGARSTARDAIRFGWAFVNKGQVDGARILERSTVRHMTTMQKSNDGAPLGMGLGWFLGRDDTGNYVEHAGGGPGINSLLRFYPRSGLVIAVLGNMNDYNPSQLLRYVVELL